MGGRHSGERLFMIESREYYLKENDYGKIRIWCYYRTIRYSCSRLEAIKTLRESYNNLKVINDKELDVSFYDGKWNNTWRIVFEEDND